jgi:uncharacterized membrane protein
LKRRISHNNLDEFLKTKDKHLNKLNQIALESIREEELLSEKLFLEGETKEKITFGQKMADKVAEFGGSWNFIMIFGLILFFWIIINTLLLVNKPFDPYPFILLNLILSCIAALQAPVIMMSQNRKEVKDRKRAENDYLINLKAELEIRMLNQKMDILVGEQMVDLLEIHRKELDQLDKIRKKKNKEKDRK